MPPLPQAQRGEEKVRLIQGQLTAIRSRLNGLALQRGLFVTLALLIAAAAMVVGAAFSLSSLVFLMAAGIVVAVSLFGSALAIRSALRMRASAARAAAIADERAGLKGRLSTLVALHKQGDRSPLWSYLVEDTLLKRDEFAPARIERRRISRSLHGLLAACALALLVIPLAAHLRHLVSVEIQPTQKPITLNLRDLRIDPSNRGAGNGGSTIEGDPATMRKLAQMVAQAEREAQNRDLLSRMIKSAHNLADNLQKKITGQSQPARARIRLADKGPGGGPNAVAGGAKHDQGKLPPSPDRNPPRFKAGDPSGGQEGANPPAKSGAANDRQSGSPGALAMQGPAEERNRNASQPPNAPDIRQGPSESRSGKNDGGRASRGAGSDPNGLFGSPDSHGRSDSGFQIAIEARPALTGDGSGDRAYPPKVNAALNPDQYPDEPLSRVAVPADDRSTIERIFER